MDVVLSEYLNKSHNCTNFIFMRSSLQYSIRHLNTDRTREIWRPVIRSGRDHLLAREYFLWRPIRKALPERGTFERVEKIIIKVLIRVVFLNTSMHLIATKNDKKTYC